MASAGGLVQSVEELDLAPIAHGQTWKPNPDWDGTEGTSRYLLPRYTLGWQILKWIPENLLSDEFDDNGLPLPFVPTPEQSRFILWMYAIDETGRFLYREIVLQRLKGWGKDPLAAVIAAVEFIGPCRLAGWATQDMPETSVVKGEPFARDNPKAWVQIAAVNQDQTKNTMSIFPSLFTEKCRRKHGITAGKVVVYAHHGARRIEAVTSSPRALEGNRPSLVIKNETQHWLRGNEGHAMADAIERNTAKSKGGAARTLSLTNAYEPSEDSVAQREREAWEEQQAGLAMKTGVMYDTLEAPEGARLRPVFLDSAGKSRDATEAETRAYLRKVLEGVRGDSKWLPIENMVDSILDRKNPPSRSRRFWFNQIVAVEDAWLDPEAIKAAIDPLVQSARRDSSDVLRAGWLLAATDPIVMFFDGSKSDDSTALVGCRLSDGYLFTIGIWQKPAGPRGETWVVDRDAVDARVDEAFDRFNIIAFWADPSHAKDSDDTRWWDGMIDNWMRRYKDQLDPEFWSVKSGHNQHAIMWDMTSHDRQRMFVPAAELFVVQLEARGLDENFKPEFRIDGHPAFVAHLKNARNFPTQWGMSLMKETRDSARKIDLAVAAVGARMLRRIVLNKGMTEKKKAGTVWGY